MIVQVEQINDKKTEGKKTYNELLLVEMSQSELTMI